MKLTKHFSSKPRGYRTEFAKKIGVSKSFLSQIETGRAKAPIEIAKKIEEITNQQVKKSELRPDVWG